MLPHLDAAYNLARWLMRDPTAAEDVVQEAMLRALTYFRAFAASIRAPGCCRSCATRVCRRPGGRGVRLVSLDDAEDENQLPASPTEDPEAALLAAAASVRFAN